MRAEITKLHHRLKTTTIYVTHDQTEAMTMADRIVIMKDGFIQQIGTPREVYNTPVNVFVAGFIGSPAMNFFDVVITEDGFITSDGGLKLKLPEGKFKTLQEHGYAGKEIIFGIRPEDIRNEQLVLESNPEAIVKSEVVVSELLGAETMLYSKIGEQEFISRVGVSAVYTLGEEIELSFNLNKAHFFDKETQEVVK